MEISIFLAQLLGPYFIIVAVGIMFNLKTYQKVMEDFCQNAALIYLGGVFALLFGLLVVLLHNVWVVNWMVIITIFGWGGIIKGIWLIAFPNTVIKCIQRYQKSTKLLTVHLFIILALGAILSILGYFVG
ncbi:MAG: hypothetical protein JSW40_07965 [Candidatus Omnitrophota bacterium]|nr:MAG: hypothetical protein JSW40_07965 [Candidatus Omnitrophota bacterium]